MRHCAFKLDFCGVVAAPGSQGVAWEAGHLAAGGTGLTLPVLGGLVPGMPEPPSVGPTQHPACSPLGGWLVLASGKGVLSIRFLEEGALSPLICSGDESLRSTGYAGCKTPGNPRRLQPPGNGLQGFLSYIFPPPRSSLDTEGHSSCLF